MQVRVTREGDGWVWSLRDENDAVVVEGLHPYPRRDKAIAVAERANPGVEVVADPE